MQRETWLPAAPESAPAARSIIREASSEHGLDGRAAWDLMLATSEAVANAVLHGTACEAPPGDGILLRVEYCDQTLCVEVCDCGCFEGNGVNPAPTDALHGRGLPIIEAVVDHFEVQTEERLTRVRFGKRRAA
jgi:serine/threonine-protein kinase RsbW